MAPTNAQCAATARLASVTDLVISPLTEPTPAVVELIRAEQESLYGGAFMRLSDLERTLAGPMTARELCCTAHRGDQLVGAVVAYVLPEVRDIYLDLQAHDGEVAAELLAAVDATWPEYLQAWEAAAEAAPAPPDVTATVAAEARGNDPVWDPNPEIWQIYADTTNESGEIADAIRSLGYRFTRRFWKMGIDFDGPVPMPEPPPGARFEVAESAEQLSSLHEVVSQSFADHWGESRLARDEWLEMERALPGAAPELWWLIYLDDQPVAALMQGRMMEPAGYGYIDTVGVAAAARGRGIAKWMLRAAFADCHARGLRGCYLEVDATSPTGADSLYRSVGMAPKVTKDIFIRPLSR